MASSGNFCTLNPLTEYNSRMNQGTISHGNTKYDDVGGDGWICNMAMTHKTYCEFRVDSIGNYGGTIGLRGMQAHAQTYDSVVFQANYSSGNIYHYKGESDQSFSGNAGSTVSAGNIVMMAYDPATYKWWVGVNGSWNGSQDPANGSNPCFTGSATMFENMNVTWGGWSGDVNRLDHTWNFGQDSTFAGQETAGGNADENGFGDFKYTPPTGFLALCTGNMVISDDIDPAQTDDDYAGGKLFNVVTWSGNGSTQSITGLGFQPDVVWIKSRTNTEDHSIYDSNRGVTKRLKPNESQAQSTVSNGFTAFDSDGFSLGSATENNGSGQTYVGWCWKVNGGTTASNSDGDITSTVQASDKTGLSVVTYTGNGSQNQSIGHGLTKAPEMVWFKNYGSASVGGIAMDWIVALSTSTGSPFISRSGSAQTLELNTSDAIGSFYRTEGNFTPTTSTFSVPNNGNAPYWFNASGGSYIAYCWHSVEGFSKFGFYEGNGNTNGAFVYTGFRPRMVFLKQIDGAAEWTVFDTARETYNQMEDLLQWDLSNAETQLANDKIDFLSNGFKLRGAGGGRSNQSSRTYLYGAWGDVPFKYNNTF